MRQIFYQYLPLQQYILYTNQPFPLFTKPKLKKKLVDYHIKVYSPNLNLLLIFSLVFSIRVINGLNL